jgi:hypothetical protein
MYLKSSHLKRSKIVSLPGAYIHPNPDLLGGLPSLGRREKVLAHLSLWVTSQNLI